MPAARSTTAKKAPAKKAPARRKPAAQLSAFDAARRNLVAKRQTETAYKWEGYGREWLVRRPNPALIAQLAEDKASFMDFVLGHFVETQRDEFLAVLAADPEFDFDIIELLVAEVEAIVYADLPLGPSSDS